MCDTIKFSFYYPQEIEKIQINTNIFRNPKFQKVIDGTEVIDQRKFDRQQYVAFERKNDVYQFEFVIEDSVRFISILFDYNLAMKYVVNVKREEIEPPKTP